MSIWTCPSCTARYAVGLPACPQCGTPSTQGDDVPKISLNGPSYEDGHAPDAAAPETAQPEPEVEPDPEPEIDPEPEVEAPRAPASRRPAPAPRKTGPDGG